MDLVIREQAKTDKVTDDLSVPLSETAGVEVEGRCGRANTAPNPALIPRGLRGSPKRIGMRFFGGFVSLIILVCGVAGPFT
jgi:hypothetical protein